MPQGLVGRLVVTFPSQRDVWHPETGPLLDKYLKERSDVPSEERRQIQLLVENKTFGRNAVGYLTESMHDAGSPEVQRIQVVRQSKLELIKALARELARINQHPLSAVPEDFGGYFDRAFRPVVTREVCH